MKKCIFFLPFIVLASNLLPVIPSVPPPMPPAMNLKTKKTVKSNPNKLPKECDAIPPMILFLPPPLESSLNECKNKLFEPKLSFAKKIFAKKHLKVKSVNIVKGFNELYEIKTDKKTFYCNKNLSKCFEVK